MKKQIANAGPFPVTSEKNYGTNAITEKGVAIKAEQDNEAAPIVEPATPTRKKCSINDDKGTPGRNPRTPTGSNSKPMLASPAKLDVTTKSTPRKRNAPKTAVADSRGIPASWDDADDADKMMLTMKDQGASWAEIRNKWTSMTGIETAPRSVFPVVH